MEETLPPHPLGPCQPLAPRAWQQAEGAGMTGEPYTGWRDSDYSPGCPVRKELPTRGERAASSSASLISTALGAGRPQRSAWAVHPWSVCGPEAQGTEETPLSPPPSGPEGREFPGTHAPRGSFSNSNEGTLRGEGTWQSWGQAGRCIGHTLHSGPKSAGFSGTCTCPQHF